VAAFWVGRWQAADVMMRTVLAGGSTWLIVVELALALLLLTSFISHTVASIVVMPLVASIGASLGEPLSVVFCCVLAVSAAMALPMSSFPNVNSLLAEDDYGATYLTPRDFVRAGLPASIAVGALIAVLGYPLAAHVL
jgi:phosphate transporter